MCKEQLGFPYINVKTQKSINSTTCFVGSMLQIASTEHARRAMDLRSQCAQPVDRMTGHAWLT